MFALFGLLLGIGGGAAGTAAWLLSEPGPEVTGDGMAQGRLAELKLRWRRAVTQGKLAGEETEESLKRDLHALQKDPHRLLVR